MIDLLDIHRKLRIPFLSSVDIIAAFLLALLCATIGLVISNFVSRKGKPKMGGDDETR